MEHVIEGCTCIGKVCTGCEQLRCFGNYTQDKRLKSKLKSRCRICAQSQFKDWRQENQEYDQQRKRAWERLHPEQFNRQRKRRLAKRRKTSKRSPSRNRTPEELKEMEREGNVKQYHKNKQSNRARVMQFFHSHPGYRGVIESNRRARKREAGGSYSFQEWETLKVKYNYTCLCCGRKEPEIQLHADHVNPVFNGGSSYIENIQPLCKSCNSSKGRRFLDFRPQNT